MSIQRPPVGELLQQWRVRHRISQMDLAHGADISPRHLSFIETGRSRPSTAVLTRLAESLDLGLRDRNVLLLSAGYAPAYSHAPFSDPEMRALHQALRDLLTAHEPYPAIVVNLYGDIEMSNSAADHLLRDLPQHLTNPTNTYRAVLHPDGLGTRIRNLPEWAHHLITRLEAKAHARVDQVMSALLEEVRSYPAVSGAPHARQMENIHLPVLPLIIDTEDGTLTLASAVTAFGAPTDVTASELSLETFLPLTDESRAILIN